MGRECGEVERPGRKGERGHWALGTRMPGQVMFDHDVIQLDEVRRSNMKSAVALKLDNGKLNGDCKA